MVPPRPGPQERRFSKYMEGLAACIGHADRRAPFLNYCKGLLLPGERKSIEPMAALLDPQNVQAMRQSLHHFVAKAPWNDEAVWEQVLAQVLPAVQSQGRVVAWVVDDPGFPKKGEHSVGVAKQHSSQLGTVENCQVAVSLALSSWAASVPVAYRLYLPEKWANDRELRRKSGVPEEIQYQTKPEIALDHLRAAREAGLPRGVVMADAAYGADARFREGVDALGLTYLVNVADSTKVRVLEDGDRLVTVKRLATSLAPEGFEEVSWQQGSRYRFQSRFAAVRVRRSPSAEQWLLIEWPSVEEEPSRYWLSTLPARTRLSELVRMAKHRWIADRDMEELKRELGLGHFEGRNWRGFHHHATLCFTAYGFLVTERGRYAKEVRAGSAGILFHKPGRRFRPRGSPEKK